MTDKTPPEPDCDCPVWDGALAWHSPSCAITKWRNRAPDTQVAPSPPPPWPLKWPDCACVTKRDCPFGQPGCEPLSPQVAPDSLVARLREHAPGQRADDYGRLAVLAQEAADALTDLKDWDIRSFFDAVKQLADGEGLSHEDGWTLMRTKDAQQSQRDRDDWREKFAQMACENMDMQTGEYIALRTRLERVTQAADAMRHAVMAAYNTTGNEAIRPADWQLGKLLERYDAIRAETPASQAGQPADESR